MPALQQVYVLDPLSCPISGPKETFLTIVVKKSEKTGHARKIRIVCCIYMWRPGSSKRRRKTTEACEQWVMQSEERGSIFKLLC